MARAEGWPLFEIEISTCLVLLSNTPVEPEGYI